ncbi:NADPH-dependent FMN reductase [Proteiniborus ethanoligenes]|uniref:NADPH-dependent FMN reductase n=1 Tax=Proteiniborus ethanoligenes TaxID=415015 RepID=A0A1H3LDW4_9FIRM|nr:NAD(P)H-dependent oxidoreductase [Proteiniborus ethanoligenes]TAH64018.1 MAG: NADPH-dependent oxidoreductase [Gottschalkiaceae bacterium]SDY62767.1 NADPH-dependent FMN reductase [Proteiniborus ethanoligenes]
MMDLYLIIPEKTSDVLSQMIDEIIEGWNPIFIRDEKNLPNLQNKRIIFAVELNDAGINLGLYRILTEIFRRGKQALYSSIGGILMHSNTELYTKTVARDIIFLTNELGLSFLGRPLVEATGSLSNFLTMQKVSKKPLIDVCLDSCRDLSMRLKDPHLSAVENPKILVLHASSEHTSNTLMLWDMVKKHLGSHTVNEIHIENGTVQDCIGCPYKICKHYGQQTSCFYGGIMVEEVYPAILDSDVLIWLCPNYNDAISANLSAVVNRLTALFRKTKFYNKSFFSIIVSGNSGSDSVAKQLIGALNINKTFRLPPYFSLMATANDAGHINKVENIHDLAKEFALNVITETEKRLR